MIIVQQVSVGVAVTVGQPVRLRAKMDIIGVTAGWIGTLVRLSVNVRNDGQRFTKGTGHITCQLDGTTRTYPVDMDTVLPGGGAALQVNGTGMHTGTWLCTVALKDSPAGTAAWTGEVVIPPRGRRDQADREQRLRGPVSPGIPAWRSP